MCFLIEDREFRVSCTYVRIQMHIKTINGTGSQWPELAFGTGLLQQGQLVWRKGYLNTAIKINSFNNYN